MVFLNPKKNTLLFPKANFVTIDAAEHDKKIAVILGLTHIINIAFANILAKDEKISEVKIVGNIIVGKTQRLNDSNIFFTLIQLPDSFVL